MENKNENMINERKSLPGGKEPAYTANNIIKFGKPESVKPFLVSADDIFKKSKIFTLIATDTESRKSVIEYLERQNFISISPTNENYTTDDLSKCISNAFDSDKMTVYCDLSNYKGCETPEEYMEFSRLLRVVSTYVYNKPNMHIAIVSIIKTINTNPLDNGFLKTGPTIISPSCIYLSLNAFIVEYDDTPGLSFMRCVKNDQNYDISKIGSSIIEPNREEEEKNGQF